MAGRAPKYLQIARELRRQIAANQLAPGDRLPTEAELAAGWAVSASTIKKALAELRSGGQIESRPREGTFVTAPSRPITITLNDGAGAPDAAPHATAAALIDCAAPEVRIQAAARWETEALGIPADQARPQIVRRIQEFFIKGEPHSVQSVCFTLELALQAPLLLQNDDIAEGTLAYLAGLGHVQAGYVDEFDARAPADDELAFFGLAKGSTAVIEHRRTAYDTAGHPFRLTITVYRPDRTKIRYIAGKVPAG